MPGEQESERLDRLDRRLEEIRPRLAVDAGGTGLPVITAALCRQLAAELDLSARIVERQALARSIVPKRYLKNLQAVSLQEQQRLLESGVSVVGLGGLGGWVLEILARMGVGLIRAVDGDFFEESNLNRQLLCTEESLGLSKAEASGQRLERINPSVELEIRSELLDADGFEDFVLEGGVVVDALGGLEVRRQLRRAAARRKAVLVTGALAGELGYVSTVFPGDSGPESLWTGGVGAEESLGCPPFAVSAVASVQCAEVIHILCGRQPRLRGRLAVLDCAGLDWQIFDL